MSRYINLEDAIHNLNMVVVGRTEYTEKMKADLFFAIDDLPTIDIVRCKECMYKYVTGDTTQYYVCDFMDAQYDENGYCHHGEVIDNE